MPNQALTVDDYVRTVPEARRAAFEKLRACCRDILTDYDEAIMHKMPTYTRNGAAEIAFASQKNYIALYVMKKDVVDRHRADLPDCGESCIRYRQPEQIDFGVVERLLRDAVASPADAR